MHRRPIDVRAVDEPLRHVEDYWALLRSKEVVACVAGVCCAVDDIFDEVIDEVPAVGTVLRALHEYEPARRVGMDRACRRDRKGVKVGWLAFGPGATRGLVEHVGPNHAATSARGCMRSCVVMVW